MAAQRPLGLFFGLILPHGLLELTCVFVAAGAGLRLGWSWIDPGAAHPRRRRSREEGQAAGALALGLAATLLVSGVDRGVRDAVRRCRPGPGSASARVAVAGLPGLRRRARRPRGRGPARPATSTRRRRPTDPLGRRRAGVSEPLRAGRRP